MFSEIDGDFDDVAIKTFKVSLPAEHGLRKSLTGKPATSVRQSLTELISTRGSRKTNNKGRERLRLSLRKGRTSGWTYKTIIDPEGILSSNLGLRLLRCLTRCSDNQYTKSWRKSRTSHSLGGQIRWEVTS